MDLTKLYIEKYFNKESDSVEIGTNMDNCMKNRYDYLRNVNLYSFIMTHEQTKRQYLFYYKEYEFNISIWNGSNKSHESSGGSNGESNGESIGWKKYNIPFLILPIEIESEINEIGLNGCYLLLGFYISKICEYTCQISDSFDEYYSEENHRLIANKRYIFLGDLMHDKIPF